MKKLIVILWIFIVMPLLAQSPVEKISSRLKAEINSDMQKNKHLIWIYFTDKGNDYQKYFVNPESVVSSKSLQRRSKVFSESSLIDFSDIPVYKNYIESLTIAGFELRNKSRWFNAASGYADKNSINKISSLPFIKKIDIVNTYSKRQNDIEFIKTDPVVDKSSQPEGIYSLNYGNSFTQNNLINVPLVHSLGYTGSGVTICVMDAGFGNLTHEAFQNMNIIAMYDFVDGSSVLGSHSHGTAVLSILGGFKEGQLIGPAYGADFILARTEDVRSETPVEEDNWIAALEWADSIGVDITSTSLGYLDFDPPYTSYTWEDMDGNTATITIAADLAVAKGIFVVNSAGNEGFHSTRNTLIAPADGDSVFSIGAVNSSGERTSFSSVGPTVDGRIKPDVMAMGSGVYYAALSGNQYWSGGGTSYSCPLVSGVSALLLEANPGLTPMELRDIIRNTSSQSSSPNREYGWGIVNALDALNNSPVPVELTAFYGSYQNGSVILEWITSTEANNRGFEIQRTNDNSLFETIGFVDGKGTTTNRITYSFIDTELNRKRYSYRLKQIDYDGSFQYSSEVLVEIPFLDDYVLHQNYPNPFNPSTRISFTVPEKSFVKITLNDILGREIRTLYNEEVTAGTKELEIDGSSLSSGNYIIRMIAGNVQKIQKITLLK
ncbi:MAG: S8 family serine peptidase [Ignavibacterium sp.]|nr:S8 family serine peptidase [Ignavibacterium sp.]